MAGRPRQRAVIDELTKRAHDEIGPDAIPLDYVERRVHDGDTYVDIANEIGPLLNIGVITGDIVRRAAYVGTDELESDARIARARVRGAAALVAQAKDIADDDGLTKDDVPQAKLRTDVRLWIAGRWDRDSYGQQPKVGVQISIGTLHMDALKAVARIQNPNQPKAQIAQDAEVVSVTPLLPNESKGEGAEVVSPSDAVSP